MDDFDIAREFGRAPVALCDVGGHKIGFLLFERAEREGTEQSCGFVMFHACRSQTPPVAVSRELPKLDDLQIIHWQIIHWLSWRRTVCSECNSSSSAGWS